MKTSDGLVSGKRTEGEAEERGGDCIYGNREEKGGGAVDMIHRKLPRTESFPFKMMPIPLYSSGPTFYNGSEGRSSDLYDVAGNAATVARTLQPFPAFKSPGVGMAATLRFPFTSAQWQELERQALIYKYMMASVPVPPDLLIPLTTSPSGAARNLGSGSCFKFNLRFSNSTDPEPGRCRRTDGKKWRCSRDVAADQKYCERHMHRGRPRSRKPVEVQTQDTSITRTTPPASASTPITDVTLSNLTTVATTTNSSHLGAKPYHHQPSRFFGKPDFKLSYPSVVSAAQDKEEPRYMDWMKVPTNPITTDPLQSYEDHLNLNYTNFGLGISESPQNSNQFPLFVNTDLSSFEHHPSSNQRQPPRRFIDAWSSGARENTTCNNKSSVSSLTLSMSAENGSTEEDSDKIEMGLSVRDSGTESIGVKSQPLSWMNPVSWIPSPLGGPLGEVLQSTATAGSNSASPHGCSNSNKSSCAGLNLMCEAWGGGEGASPRETSPRLVSSPSPTGVLQKTLASLSDSSSSSSPTFAAAKSKMAFEWLNQPKLPSSS